MPIELPQNPMSSLDSAVKNLPAVPRHHLILISGLFFLSGSAGLVYQVLWMRNLGLFFGSDMFGVAIILSTFMGGLALGSLLGGKISERVQRPLMLYGLMEIGIGLMAICIPTLLELFDPILRIFYPEAFLEYSNFYQLMRVILASGTILIPTTMMGATLPLIMRHFVRNRTNMGGKAAWFYAVNTLGALVGTLAAGFYLLPQLGMSTSTLTAAVINIAIGSCCILIALKASAPGVANTQDQDENRTLDTLPDTDSASRARIAQAAIIGIGISGVASFALEVVWTRILLMSFSATVYSFASMLACFLFGIFLGSMLVSKLVDRIRNPLALLAGLEIGVGLAVSLLCVLINVIPEFFSRVLSTSMGVLSPGDGGSIVLSTLLTSFFLLLIPATLLGATFSVALRAYTMNVSRIGSRTGNLYFSNTLGAIMGSLGGVLILLPLAGTKGGLALIALLFAINGAWLWSVQYGVSIRSLLKPGLVLPLAITVSATTVGIMLPYQVTLNFNQHTGNDTKLVYHREGIQNTIDILRSDSDITSLVIGGNIEADNGYIQKRHFILKGHLPLMFMDKADLVLVVGLGMGITLQATANHDDVAAIHVVELSPEILKAHDHLGTINGHVVSNPKVSVRIDDGRNYMKQSGLKYDMITADPIHPKISRVGYLYTREYYESIKRRLKPGGVVCQWMPIYQMSPTRLRSAIKTFVDVFPGASFWYVKNHGLLLAQPGSPKIDYQLLAKKFTQAGVREDLSSININSPEDLLSLLLLGPEEISKYINAEQNIPMNTDDYPYLEYFVPGDFFYRPLDNVRELVKYSTDPTRLVANQPVESINRVRSLVQERERRLIEELLPAKPANNKRGG